MQTEPGPQPRPSLGGPELYSCAGVPIPISVDPARSVSPRRCHLPSHSPSAEGRAPKSLNPNRAAGNTKLRATQQYTTRTCPRGVGIAAAPHPRVAYTHSGRLGIPPPLRVPLPTGLGRGRPRAVQGPCWKCLNT